MVKIMHNLSPTLPSVQVAVGIIWQGSNFLAAQRPHNKPRGGLWEFPGGKQEHHETLEQTLIRELQEELDITPTTIIPWKTHEHTYPDLHVTLHFMHILDFRGTPIPCEGQILRWISPLEAFSYPFLAADTVVLEQLRHIPHPPIASNT